MLTSSLFRHIQQCVDESTRRWAAGTPAGQLSTSLRPPSPGTTTGCSAGSRASAPTKPIDSPYLTSTKLPTGRSQNSKWVRSVQASLARAGAPPRRPVIPHVLKNAAVRQQTRPTQPMQMHHRLLVQVRQIKDCWEEAEQHFKSETGGFRKNFEDDSSINPLPQSQAAAAAAASVNCIWSLCQVLFFISFGNKIKASTIYIFICCPHG